MTALRALAAAKINLTLRITGRRTDGYHVLNSLVAFADFGDGLALSPGAGLSLEVDGPFAGACPADHNLVLQAAQNLKSLIPTLQWGHFMLTKNIPVAAGLGGGSADAGAALRLLAQLNALSASDERLMQAASATGADVPACLLSTPCWMRGIGDVVAPLPMGRTWPMVLVNPGIALSTRDVFAHYNGPYGAVEEAGMPLSHALLHHGNDLEPVAIALCPDIRNVLDDIRRTQATVARLSGSGATCFGIYSSAEQATYAAAHLQAWHPAWWVKAVRVSGPADLELNT